MKERNNKSDQEKVLIKTNFEEAIMQYARGNDKIATQLTLSTILESSKSGNDPETLKIAENKKNWFLVFDMFQALKKENNSNKLALFYSNFFKTTPPVYDPNFLSSVVEHDNLGRTNLNIDISISNITESKIQDFEISSIKNKTCLINFSRSSVEEDNPNTLKKLYSLRNAMKNIRINKVDGVIMGESDFIQEVLKIIKKIEVNYAGKEDQINKLNQVYWLFLCEVYQWLGEENEFNKLSYNYTKLFKITPPAFNKDFVMKRSEQYNKSNKQNGTNRIVLSGDIDKNQMFKIVKNVKAQIDKINMVSNEADYIPNIYLDFSNVTRVDYEAALEFVNFLNQEFEGVVDNKINKNKFIIENPFEFIIRLFDIIGASNYVTYRERNRNIGGKY